MATTVYKRIPQNTAYKSWVNYVNKLGRMEFGLNVNLVKPVDMWFGSRTYVDIFTINLKLFKWNWFTGLRLMIFFKEGGAPLAVSSEGLEVRRFPNKKARKNFYKNKIRKNNNAKASM